MTKVFNVDETREMIKSVIKGREDYVYEAPTIKVYHEIEDVTVEEEAPDCLYSTPDGAPSCIVGQVLHKYLPEEFDLVHHQEFDDNLSDGDYPAARAVSSLDEIEDRFDREARDLLVQVQNRQDTKVPWGKVLD